LLLFDQEQLFIGHVGDSRVYLVRHGLIWQMTRDHSLVSEKLKAGLITRDQLKTDQNKNVITRSVGFESSVLVDIYRREVAPGDLYLACSDGLSGLVEDEEILSVLSKVAIEGDDLEKAIHLLIKLANKNGGDDNISIVLAKVL
jgi:serine/threonine protein phosphatase PrpC